MKFKKVKFLSQWSLFFLCLGCAPTVSKKSGGMEEKDNSPSSVSEPNLANTITPSSEHSKRESKNSTDPSLDQKTVDRSSDESGSEQVDPDISNRGIKTENRKDPISTDPILRNSEADPTHSSSQQDQNEDQSEIVVKGTEQRTQVPKTNIEEGSDGLEKISPSEQVMKKSKQEETPALISNALPSNQKLNSDEIVEKRPEEESSMESFFKEEHKNKPIDPSVSDLQKLEKATQQIEQNSRLYPPNKTHQNISREAPNLDTLSPAHQTLDSKSNGTQSKVFDETEKDLSRVEVEQSANLPDFPKNSSGTTSENDDGSGLSFDLEKLDSSKILPKHLHSIDFSKASENETHDTDYPRGGLDWKAEPLNRSEGLLTENQQFETIDFDNSPAEFEALRKYLKQRGQGAQEKENLSDLRYLDDLETWNNGKTREWDPEMEKSNKKRRFSEVYRWIQSKGKQSP